MAHPLNRLPRRVANDSKDSSRGVDVERLREPVASVAPCRDVAEPECPPALAEIEVWLRKVLVCDSVSPTVQEFQLFLTALVPLVQVLYFLQLETESAEVGADVSWVWVSGIEFARGGQQCSQDVAARWWRGCVGNVVCRLGVKIATETLKVRGQQYGVCVNDLFRSVPPTRRGATDRGMGRGDLVERHCPEPFPPLKGDG